MRVLGRHKRIETSGDPRRTTSLLKSCQMDPSLPRALDIPAIMIAARRRRRTINNNRKIIILCAPRMDIGCAGVRAAVRVRLWIGANCEEWTRVSADRWFDIWTLSRRTRPRTNDPGIHSYEYRNDGSSWSRSRTEVRVNRASSQTTYDELARCFWKTWRPLEMLLWIWRFMNAWPLPKKIK